MRSLGRAMLGDAALAAMMGASDPLPPLRHVGSSTTGHGVKVGCPQYRKPKRNPSTYSPRKRSKTGLYKGSSGAKRATRNGGNHAKSKFPGDPQFTYE